MKDLIAINYDNQKPTVSGRELQIETRYSDWFPRMCDYGFREGKDYYSFLSNRSDGLPGKPKTDHIQRQGGAVNGLPDKNFCL